jgi:hypothetical protein
MAGYATVTSRMWRVAGGMGMRSKHAAAHRVPDPWSRTLAAEPKANGPKLVGVDNSVSAAA